MERSATGLLLSAPATAQFVDAMKLCVDPTFIPFEDARPPSKKKHPGLRTALGAHGIRSSNSESDDDDDSDAETSSESSDDDSHQSHSVKRESRTKKDASPPGHYDGFCRTYFYEALHEQVAKLSLFRQSRKPHCPFPKSATSRPTSRPNSRSTSRPNSRPSSRLGKRADAHDSAIEVDDHDDTGEAAAADESVTYLEDLKNGVTQAIHVYNIEVRPCNAGSCTESIFCRHHACTRAGHEVKREVASNVVAI